MIEKHSNTLSLSHLDFPLIVERQTHSGWVERHSHDFIEFVYMDRGFSIHQIENETSIIMTGDIFFVLPGVAHEYRKTVNNTVYNCVFFPDVLGENLEKLRSLPLLKTIFTDSPPAPWGKLHLPYPQRLEAAVLLKKLLAETAADRADARLNAQSLLTQLLVLLSRIQPDVLSTEGLPDNDSTGHILEVLTYCLDHSATVAEMAEISGYSRDHFSKLFKKYTGISPISYLNTLKAANAAELLLSSNLPIAHIAERTGFDDVNYFSRLFKKETGFTPSHFREQFEAAAALELHEKRSK